MSASLYSGQGLLNRLTAEFNFKSEGRRPVVGIAGFFGHGNYGDELFLNVFAEHFGKDFELRILPDLPEKPYFSKPIEDAVRDVDAIIIGGGDLIQPWATDERYFNKEYLKKPVFFIGIGVPVRASSNQVQVEKPFIVDRYKRFFGHPNVKFIHARDPQSAQWIQTKLAPNVPVVEAPDIVCSLSLPPADQTSGNRRKLLGIVTRLRPGRTDPDDYSQLERLGAHAIAIGWSVRHIILGNGNVGQRDRENADRLSIPEKELIFDEDLDVLSRAIGECNCLASMKFHGSVVATMYGVPSIVLIPTSKNRNFMRRIGREDLLSTFDAMDLVEKYREFPSRIDESEVETLRRRATDVLTQVRTGIYALTSNT